MYISKENEQAYAEARRSQQQIFQEKWNHFLKSPGLLAGLLLYSVSQVVFLLLSGMFVYDIAVSIGVLYEGYPFWCNLVILAIQLMLFAPGALSCAALFRMRKNGAWQGEKNTLPGFSVLRAGNLGVSVAGGIALGLYPTVIITAGEYLGKEAVQNIFYLFLAMTCIFLICIVLVRPVLRHLEENVCCCLANTDYVFPLILVMAAVIVAAVLLIPYIKLFSLGVALVALSVGNLLVLYLRFLQKTSAMQEKIEHKLLSKRQDPDDPYNRY